MQEFIEYFDKLSEQYDLILRIEKSKYRKWEVYIYRKGFDMPIVSITDKDKKRAFSTVYLEMKRYMERMKQ